MDQSQHQFIATLLIIITAFALNFLFPFEQEKKFWQEWIKNKFNLWS